MSTRDSFVKRSYAAVRRASKRPRFVFAAIFVFLLLLHAFIFRNVISKIPETFSGASVVSREELVPFYRFDSQFFTESTSSLTSSDEIRVAYSFWTAWVRYYKVLPFALVVMNAVTAFMIFYAFYRILRHFTRGQNMAIYVALLAALPIHLVLLYAKITHFYELLFGFGMFSLSLSLVIEQIFFSDKLSWKNMAAVIGLTLLNPAIHYHVIFYLVLFLLVAIHLLLLPFVQHEGVKKRLKKDLMYFVIVTLLSLVPYMVYISIIASSSLSSVSTQIPDSYWMLYYTSTPLRFMFTYDIAAQTDMYQYGNYLVPTPRTPMIVLSLFVCSIFLFRQWKRIASKQRNAIAACFIVLLISMWMALGYSEANGFSFHILLSHVMEYLSAQGGFVTTELAKAVAVFINILRFPHRFLFIYFYLAGVLLSIALLWAGESLRMRKLNKYLVAFAIAGLALVPVFASSDHRSVLLSGDFAGFMRPYPISQDLPTIKSKLTDPSGKMLVFPTLESGRQVIMNGRGYDFLDKFFVYYFNQPTLYYGTGANTENKTAVYLAYQAIDAGQSGWDNVIANDLGITYILEPKHVQQRDKGLTYMPGIEDKIAKALPTSTRYQRVYDGADFALYKLKPQAKPSQQTLVDMGWPNLSAYIKSDTAPHTVYYPSQWEKPFSATRSQRFALATDSTERSFYDLYAALNPKAGFKPDMTILPFTKNITSSSLYTNNALSLTTLADSNDRYNYFGESVPSLVSLQSSQFVGITEGKGSLSLDVKAAQSGKYRIALHAASQAAMIKTLVDGKPVYFHTIGGQQQAAGSIDFTYYTLDVDLSKGTHKIQINDISDSLLVESGLAIPLQAIPHDFGNATADNFTITTTQGAYNVTVNGSK